MIDIPKSTQEEPLKFFQWMFLENNFFSYRDDFFSQFVGYEIIEKGDDEISYYNFVYDESTGNTIYNAVYKQSFSKKLKTELNSEYNNSLKLIKLSIADIILRGSGSNSLPYYFDLLFTDIQGLLIQTQAISKKYPLIEEYLTKLKVFIEKEQDKFSPSLKEIDKTEESSNFIKYKGNTRSLERFKSYLINKNLIDEPSDFIEIFTEKPFNKKINWIAPKNLFHYFIDKLSEVNPRILKFNRDKKWLISSEIFTIKENIINPDDIKGNNKPPIPKKKKEIDEAIKIINF